MSIRAISFTGMKQANRLSVLRLARAAGPISRADIADRTGLTPSTVANAVNELLAKGLLRVGETAPSEGGRRPVLVEFNEKHAYVVGVNVGFTVIVAVVTDLSGRIVGRFALPTLPEEGPTPVMERVVTAIKRAIENARV